MPRQLRKQVRWLSRRSRFFFGCLTTLSPRSAAVLRLTSSRR